MKNKRIAIALVLVSALAAFTHFTGCSGQVGGSDDPAVLYDTLVKAAARRDFGVLYDRLDDKMRSNVNTLITLSYRTKDSMPEPERSFWDSVGRQKPRDAFIAIMNSDPQMTASLSGDYKVISADTMVVLTIQRTGLEPELRYFQVEAGQLRVSDPPAPPMPTTPMPQSSRGAPSNAPPMPQTSPGAPSGAPSSAPPLQAPGDTP